MKLKRGGLIWNLLMFYGYDSWDLTVGGVSLCRVFWSLVAGLPFVLAWKGLCGWARWIFSGLDSDTPPGLSEALRTFLKSLTFPSAFSAALYLLSIDRYLTLPFKIALAAWALAFTIVGILFLVDQIDNPFKDTVLGEAASFVSTGILSAKAKVCPIITFKSEDVEA